MDSQLQQVIRENLYLRAVPCEWHTPTFFSNTGAFNAGCQTNFGEKNMKMCVKCPVVKCIMLICWLFRQKYSLHLLNSNLQFTQLLGIKANIFFLISGSKNKVMLTRYQIGTTSAFEDNIITGFVHVCHLKVHNGFIQASVKIRFFFSFIKSVFILSV